MLVPVLRLILATLVLQVLPLPTTVIAEAGPVSTLSRAKFDRGDQLVSNLSLTGKGRLLVETADGLVKPIPLTITIKSADITTIVKSENGAPAETIVDYLTGHTAMRFTTNVEGEEKVSTTFEEEPLVGRRIRYVLKSGVWEGQPTEGDPIIDEAVKRLLSEYSDPTDDFMLPDRPVRPGDRWNFDGHRLRRFIGRDALRIKGQGEGEYERVVELDGRRHGLCHFRFEVEGTFLDEEGEEFEMKMALMGQSWIDLATQTETQGKGKVTLSGAMRLPGIPTPAKMSVSGELKSTSRVLRPKQ